MADARPAAADHADALMLAGFVGEGASPARLPICLAVQAPSSAKRVIRVEATTGPKPGIETRMV